MRPWPSIPGETPIEDISGLKIKSVRHRAALNAPEAENIRRAVLKYLAAKPSRRLARFDLKWLKVLHREMLGNVWTWAGEFRRVELNLGVPHQQIEEQLHNLLGDLEAWDASGMPLVEQAALLHHRAVRIHPFLNGNGRWARLLANIWLKRHDHPLTEWPEGTIGAESTVRADYLVAIKAADGGDYRALLELHRRFTPESNA
jgi:Fic-DOC domain mobile mystery protein B